MSADFTLVQALARFVAATTYDSLPTAVVQSVKQRILDTLGICLAAYARGLGDGVADLVGVWGGCQQASLVGRLGRYPAPNAALLNGTLAHSLDFDDTHLPSILHPSASVVPAALAIGEAVGAHGRDVLAAVAAGLEVNVRVGMASYVPEVGNSVMFENGIHATSMCGAIASSALAAKLLGLGVDGVAHAMGIACSLASGLIEANRSGGSVKRLHCGWAAHAGLSAALLAQRGYTGPPTALEGRFGFYQAFSAGKFNSDVVTDGLGTDWSVPGIFFKPYPANHFTHAAIDAAMAIRRKYRLDPDQIERIDLGTAAAPLRTIGEPREHKIRPQTGYHAQFSGPFTVATALLGGGGLGVYFDDFTDEAVRDPRRLALAAKVHPFVDEECNRLFPYQFPAVVRVTLANGIVLEERVMANRGGPENPLSDRELRLKFSLNASQAVSGLQAEQLADAIFALDRTDGVGKLLALSQSGAYQNPNLTQAVRRSPVE